MLLHWYILTAGLYIKLTFCAILAFPPFPAILQNVVANWCTSSIVRNTMKVYFIAASIVFVETVIELMNAKPPPIGDAFHEEIHRFESDKLINQRNALISGLSIFLLLLINQLIALKKEIIRLYVDSEVLKKQAKNVSSEYMKLVSENENKSSPKTEDFNLDRENKELKRKLEKSQSEVIAIKKQAESQQDAFIKLQEENKSLKNKLDDFNLLFGETQKKKV